MNIPIQPILGLTLGLLFAAPLSGSNLIVSSLGSDVVGTHFLVDSAGLPLPAGSLVQVVTFAGMTTPEINELANQGAVGLLASATAFGDPVSVGQGAEGSPGDFEVVVSQPLDAPVSGLHVVILNAATAAEATELLVLSIPEPAPADDLSGVPGYLAVHLEDTALVFGSLTAGGFASAPAGGNQGEGYDAWILAKLGESSPAADRLPGADPDGDRFGNLVEYALGSDPADGASLGQLSLRGEAGGFFLEYLRRTDDSSLIYAPESTADLASDGWLPLADSPQAVPLPPFPAPSGYEWARQAVPSAADRGFARMRVERTP